MDYAMYAAIDLCNKEDIALALTLLQKLGIRIGSSDVDKICSLIKDPALEARFRVAPEKYLEPTLVHIGGLSRRKEENDNADV